VTATVAYELRAVMCEQSVAPSCSPEAVDGAGPPRAAGALKDGLVRRPASKAVAGAADEELARRVATSLLAEALDDEAEADALASAEGAGELSGELKTAQGKVVAATGYCRSFRLAGSM
jgi:hypothetical protein